MLAQYRRTPTARRPAAAAAPGAPLINLKHHLETHKQPMVDDEEVANSIDTAYYLWNMAEDGSQLTACCKSLYQGLVHDGNKFGTGVETFLINTGNGIHMCFLTDMVPQTITMPRNSPWKATTTTERQMLVVGDREDATENWSMFPINPEKPSP